MAAARRRLLGLAAAPDKAAAIRELELMLDDDGWPTLEEAGEDGAEAALQLALAATDRPAFMRLCLTMLLGSVRRGEAPPEHAERLAAKVDSLSS